MRQMNAARREDGQRPTIATCRRALFERLRKYCREEQERLARFVRMSGKSASVALRFQASPAADFVRRNQAKLRF